MKYRMLWVDDSPEWVAPIRESVQEYLEELGFDLVADLHTDGSGVTDHLAKESVDLIAIDFKLKGSHGDKIIEAIRQSDKYTEILFYTADENYRAVLPVQDGVYRAHRRDVETKLRGLIALTLKRVQTPANMRGCVIAETADIEALLEDILVAQFADKGSLFRRRVLQKGIYDFGKKYQFVMGLIDDRLKACNVVLSGKGGDKVAEGDLKARLEPLQATLKEFEKEVIRTRNLLAHVKEQLDDQGRVTLKSTIIPGTITIDHAWCVKVRKDLSKQHKALKALTGIPIG
ncbi:MAG: response regulator [Kiritimatiellia bacterium]|jgi:CheY-like chemotaxis protein